MVKKLKILTVRDVAKLAHRALFFQHSNNCSKAAQEMEIFFNKTFNLIPIVLHYPT